MAVIIDASVSTAWFVDHPFSKTALPFQNETLIVIPAICLVETANAILKYVKLGAFSVSDLDKSIRFLHDRVDEVAPDYQLLKSASRIAIENNHKVYDCLYLALALDRNMQLITGDKRLAALAAKLSIETQLISPSP